MHGLRLTRVIQWPSSTSVEWKAIAIAKGDVRQYSKQFSYTQAFAVGLDVRSNPLENIPQVSASLYAIGE